MNGGHSALAVLLSNPRLNVEVFDMMMWKYSKPVADLLSLSFGKRFRLHAGNSHTEMNGKNATVPTAIRQGLRCDLIFVDGDHEARGAFRDLVNLRRAARPNALVLIDDIFLGGASGPGGALYQVERHKVMHVLRRYGPFAAGVDVRNPCMRARDPANAYAIRGRGLFCVDWGYAVAQYANISTSSHAKAPSFDGMPAAPPSASPSL